MRLPRTNLTTFQLNPLLRSVYQSHPLLRPVLPTSSISTSAIPSPPRHQQPPKMKTLGLLGGLTYHATTLYYTQINAHIQSALGNGHSAKLLLHSFDFADLMSHFHAKDYKEYTRQLIDAGTNLKRGGADAIVLCVNTGHMFADEVEKGVGLELLHIMDYAGRAVQSAGLKRVALLGTKPTMTERFMVDRLEALGLEVLIPDQEACTKMDEIIFGPLAGGVVTDEIREFYVESVKGLVGSGAQGVILACTELGFVLKEGEGVDVPLFDTVKLHARGVAEWALQE